MLKIENTKVVGFEEAIRGMRNPMNSWNKSDSYNTYIVDEQTQEAAPYEFFLGEKDHDLAMRLASGGPVHGKYKRMIIVYCDITAPLYWWKEFDTYKVGTVANSCSTMHKIHAKEFTLEDFSHEHLFNRADLLDPKQRLFDPEHDVALSAVNVNGDRCYFTAEGFMKMTCDILNNYREKFLETNDKRYWWQMIQLLPSSYNQRRTVMMNYEVLTNIYNSRRDHKLDEWHTLCDWIEQLPDSDLIIGEREGQMVKKVVKKDEMVVPYVKVDECRDFETDV